MKTKFYLGVHERHNSTSKPIHRSSKNSFTVKGSVHFNSIELENNSKNSRISRNSIKLVTKKSDKSLPKRQAFKNNTVLNHCQTPFP